MNKKQLIDLIKDLPDHYEIYFENAISLKWTDSLYKVNSIYTQEYIPHAIREEIIVLTNEENKTKIHTVKTEF